MQDISIEKVDIVVLDKMCKRAANDVRRLFEMFAEKPVSAEPDGALVVKSLPMFIGPDGNIIVELDSYDWVSIRPNDLLLDALTCSVRR